MKRMTYFVLLIWLIATGTADAQYQSAGFQSDVSKVGTVAVPFLTIGIGARATAMGSAFTAVASDVTALYWNPAGIASFDQNQLTLIHSEWIADLKHDFIGLAVPLGTMGSIGFNLKYPYHG